VKLKTVFVEQRKREVVVRKGAPGFGELEGLGAWFTHELANLLRNCAPLTWVTNKPFAWFGLWGFDLAGQTNLLLT